MKKIFFLCITTCIILGCQNTLKNNEINAIRQNYTEEEIHYYYDVVFGPEGLGNLFGVSDVKRVRVEKFQKEIKYHIQGHVDDERLAFTKSTFDTLAQLTSLKTFHVQDKKEANFLVIFTRKDELTVNHGIENTVFDTINFLNLIRGMGHNTTDKDGTIEMAYAISLVDVNLSQEKNLHVMLEEVTQGFGLGSDSYKYPNSIFYEGENYVGQLSNLDKRIIGLHYSPYIKAGLKKSEFYEAFKDILRKPTQKEELNNFENFIKQSKFSNTAIKMFCETAFTDSNEFIEESHIQKFVSDQLMVKSNDSMLIGSVITCLRKNIPYLSFNEPEPQYKGALHLSFNPFSNKDTLRISGSNRYCDKLIDYQLSYSDVFYNPKLSKKIGHKILVRNALNALGLNLGRKSKYYGDSDLLSYRKNDKITLSQYDQELLKLFFHPSLKSGMTRKNVLGVLQKYYNLHAILPLYKPYEKLEAHIKSLTLSKKAKEYIKNYLSGNDKIIKWGDEILVKTEGSPNSKDIKLLKNIIKNINRSIGEDKLFISNDSTPDELIDYKINYSTKKETPQIKSIKVIKYKETYPNTNEMKKLKAIISVYEKEPILRNKNLTANFIKSMLSTAEVTGVYANMPDNSIEITDWGKEVLQLIYHPTLHNGMEKKKILGILEKHNDFSSINTMTSTNHE